MAKKFFDIIFSDFDGTLTNSKGEVTEKLVHLLHHHKDFCKEFVIISGRSLSWGHFLLSHFPLNYVVMEGGGVILRKVDKKMEEIDLISKEEILRLEKVTEEIVKKIGEKYLSKDSFGRRTDRAIEWYQLDKDQQQYLLELVKHANVHYSISNVHLNLWVGEINKFRGASVLKEIWLTHLKNPSECFFGDALNDESMFEKMTETIGVSNITHALDQFTFRPKTILEGKENECIDGVLNFLQGND